MLLTGIEKYIGTKQLYYREQRFWDDAHLTAVSYADNSTIHSCTTYAYDKNHNVIKEYLYGDLTGQTTSTLSLDRTGQPIDEIECHAKIYAYSDDGYNNLIQQGDANTNTVQYRYKKNTNLLKKKLISVHGFVKLRYLYEYDENGVLIELTCDDDFGEEKNRIMGPERNQYSTYIQPSTSPIVGLPSVVKTTYTDKATDKECLREKRVNTFDSYGNCIKQEMYDSNGQLYATTYATYTYDGNRNKISEKKKDTYTHYTYNVDNQCTEETIKYADGLKSSKKYDQYGDFVSETDHFGNSTYYEHDLLGRVVKITSPQLGHSCPTQEYTYDSRGNIVQATDAKGYITVTEYNCRGKPTTIFHPTGAKEIFKYDVAGHLHRHVDRHGNLWIYEYDYQARLINTEHFTVSDKGPGRHIGEERTDYNTFFCTKRRKKNGSSRFFEYDSAGRLICDTEETTKREYSYDARNRLSCIKKWINDVDFITEVIQRDAADRIIEKRIEDIHGMTQLRKSFVYDAFGNLTQEIDHIDRTKKATRTQTYNGQHQPVTSIDEEGHKTIFEYSYSHKNTIGQKVLKKTVLHPSDTKTISKFDAHGNIVQHTLVNKKGQTIAKKELSYDLSGNLIEEITHVIDTETAKPTQSPQIKKWVHGPNNRLERFIESCGSAHERITSYTYNENDLIDCLERPKGAFYYTYDDANRISSISLEKGGEKLRSFTYDKVGNLIGAHNFESDPAYLYREFDSLGRLVEENISDSYEKYKLTYAHDLLGRITKMTLPDESQIIYEYEGCFLKKIHRADSFGTIQYTHECLEYDQRGLLKKENLIENSGIKTSSWNSSGREIETHSKYFHQNIFDVDDTVLGISTNNIKKTYAYDDLEQLTFENGEHQYRYDSLYNCIEKNGQKRIHNDLNQLISTKNSSYTYHSSGALAEKNIPEQGSWLFNVSMFDELIQVTSPEQKEWNYYYDGLSRKISAEDGDSVKRFFYFGNQEIGAMDSEGKIVELKVPGWETSVAFELYEKLFIPVYDLQKNVVALVDPKRQEITEQYTYSAFGSEESELSRNPWKYADRRKDETGLVCFTYRHYDPSIGRWICEDPAGTIDGANLYAYVWNNPFSYKDSFGLSNSDYYTTANSFIEYFQEPRKDPHKGGGGIYEVTNTPLFGSALVIAVPFEAPVLIAVAATALCTQRCIFASIFKIRHTLKNNSLPLPTQVPHPQERHNLAHKILKTQRRKRHLSTN